MPVHRGLIQHFRPVLPLGLIERGGRGQGSGRLRVATFTGDPSCKRSLAFLRGSWGARRRHDESPKRGNLIPFLEALFPPCLIP